MPPVNFIYFVNETDPVIFTCSATGIPPPEITWMRNRVPFSNSRVTLSDPTMPELYSTDGGNIFFVSRNLTLDNTMDADSGTYNCVASNGNAVTPSVTQDFELFVNGMHRFSWYLFQALFVEWIEQRHYYKRTVLILIQLCFIFLSCSHHPWASGEPDSGPASVSHLPLQCHCTTQATDHMVEDAGWWYIIAAIAYE